jgi:hypothetical protein
MASEVLKKWHKQRTSEVQNLENHSQLPVLILIVAGPSHPAFFSMCDAAGSSSERKMARVCGQRRVPALSASS